MNIPEELKELKSKADLCLEKEIRTQLADGTFFHAIPKKIEDKDKADKLTALLSDIGKKYPDTVMEAFEEARKEMMEKLIYGEIPTN